jgi:hypothetical protein
MPAGDYALHRLWEKIRRPFVVPQSICSHTDSWEIYDMHLAGCSNCGVMHLCEHETCPKSVNCEGHSICSITGLCTKMLNFSNLEYLETVQPTSHRIGCREHAVLNRQPRLSRKKRFKKIACHTFKKHSVLTLDIYEKVDDLINSFVWNMLCSDQWTASNDLEYKRYKSKWTCSFTKVILLRSVLIFVL